MEHDAIMAITHFLVICYPGAILGYESSDAYCKRRMAVRELPITTHTHRSWDCSMLAMPE